MMRNALVQTSFSHSHLQQSLAQADEVVIGVLGTTRAASVERRRDNLRLQQLDSLLDMTSYR